MDKRFGELFSESWKEYLSNFRFFLIILLLFVLVPGIIGYLVGLPINTEIAKLSQNASVSEDYTIFSEHVFSWSLLIVWGIIAFLLSIFAYASIIYGSFHKKKLIDFKTSLVGGRKYFFRFLGLTVIVLFIFFMLFVVAGITAGITAYISSLSLSSIMILLILLFVLVIIAIIALIVYLGVKWSFSAYHLISENKGVFESLRESNKMVYRKWWRTFGYLLLFGIILFAISFAISFVFGIINLILNPNLLTNVLSGKSLEGYSDPLWYINGIINLISQFFTNLITVPLSLLFGKNFYLSRRKSK